MFLKWSGFVAVAILAVLYLAALLFLRLATAVAAVVHVP